MRQFHLPSNKDVRLLTRALAGVDSLAGGFLTPWTAVEEVKAGLRMDCWEETPKASAPARHATTERAVKRMVAIQLDRRGLVEHYQSDLHVCRPQQQLALTSLNVSILLKKENKYSNSRLCSSREITHSSILEPPPSTLPSPRSLVTRHSSRAAAEFCSYLLNQPLNRS